MVKIAFSPIYYHELPEGHRFPMLKYELIPEQLLHEGTITQENIFVPNMCDAIDVLRTHDLDYYNKLINQQLSPSEQRKIGFPQSPALIERELVITRGTIDCALFALEYGCALNIAGGTHHAFAERGEGFCLLNDMAIAADYLLYKKLVTKILVIDLDVHQGNGTAKLMENEPRAFTFSMHGKNNYPFHKEQSDLDIPLADGISGHAYLEILEKTLPMLLETVNPDFIFYLSGVDILSTDKFGKFNVSIDECKRRDELVLKMAYDNKIPIAIAMGGGYSPDINDILQAHCNTFRIAANLF
jgi:acetoin utilization deacetylase AcuC-like enzyme